MNLKKILATVVALTMMLSSMGVIAFAEGTTVAKIGDTPFATLADAVSAANPGDTITFISTATVDAVKATVNKAVAIDLGGNEITDAYIIVTADVTITNGDITNTTEPYPLVVQDGGKLTVNNVDIAASKSDRAIWVRDNSSLVFESGSILATKGEGNTKNKIYGIFTSTNTTVDIKDGTIIVDAGETTTAVGVFGNYENADVNMSGGKISTSGKSYCYGIWVDGDVAISNGEIVTNEKGYGYSSGIRYGNNYAVNTKGNVTITGGKITTNGYSGYLVSVADDYSGTQSTTVNISNVEFKNDLSEVEQTTGGHKAPYLVSVDDDVTTVVEITSGTFEGVSSKVVDGDKTQTTISGGTFENAPNEEYLADGVVYDEETGKVIVPPTGTIVGTLFNLENSNCTYISIDLRSIKATNEIKIELYDENDTLLATTTANQKVFDELSQYMPMNLTPMMCITGSDSYWTTVWEEDMPRADYVPAYATLYLDGTEMNSANVNMASTSGEMSVNWADVQGVNPAPIATATYEVGAGKEYATLDAAINAAMTENSENIIYNIYGKNTIVRTNYFDVVGTGTTSVKFVGQDDLAEIFLDYDGHYDPDNADVASIETKADITFENLKISHNKPINAYGYDAGDREGRFSVEGPITVKFSECTFDRGIYTATDKTIIDKCIFNGYAWDEARNKGEYMVWVAGDGEGSELEVSNSEFNGYRAIKLYNENAGKQIAVTLTDNVISVTEKAAVETDNATSSVVMTGNTFNGCNGVDGDGFTDEPYRDSNTYNAAATKLVNADDTKSPAFGLISFYSDKTAQTPWCAYKFMVNLNSELSNIVVNADSYSESKTLDANLSGNVSYGVIGAGIDMFNTITVNVQ